MTILPNDEEMIFGDANERFIGEELDEEKMDKLNKLKVICVEIGTREPEIRYRACAFSNLERNASVMLDFPRVYFGTEKGVMLLIAEAMGVADYFSTSTLGDGLRLTFGIHDMWSKFRYDI